MFNKFVLTVAMLIGLTNISFGIQYPFLNNFKIEISKLRPVKVKKRVRIYFIKNDITYCDEIYRTLNGNFNKLVVKNKEKLRNKINKCFSVFNIPFKKKINMLDNIIEEKQFKLYKRYLKKFGIIGLTGLEQDYILYHNFNFGGIYLEKNYVELSLKEYLKYKRFTKQYNTIILYTLKQSNKLNKQNIYKGWQRGLSFNKRLISDGVKCGTYTNTLFTSILLYTISYYTKKGNNFFKVYKKRFNSIDKFRINRNKKERYLGWTEKDIKDYLAGISYGMLVGERQRNFKLKLIDDFKINQNQKIIHIYNISVGNNGVYHAGILFLGGGIKKIYWPDLGIIEKDKREFLGKKVKYDIENEVNVLINN